MIKIANIDREILHNFWTTWGISMKISGKMWLLIILKVTKKQGFTLFLEDTSFEKPQKGGSNWPPAVLGLIEQIKKQANAEETITLCKRREKFLGSETKIFISRWDKPRIKQF